MSIAQLIQAAPSRANELFAKLAGTSPKAVTARERLLAELREELDRQALLAERHLIPAMRRHPTLRRLVAEVREDDAQTRALAGDLERMPKNHPDFPATVAELRRAFQRHLRDGDKQLLPAVRALLAGPASSSLREASVALATLSGASVTGGERVSASVARPVRPLANPLLDGLETLASLPGVATSAADEVRRVWLDWLEAQNRLANEALRLWFGAGLRFLEIASGAARATLRPIERQTERLKESARRTTSV